MIKKRKISNFVLLILIFLPLNRLAAQGPPPPFGDRSVHPEERERIRENIETLRMWRLLEALDLSSEQSIQFLPALKEFQDARRRFQEKKGDILGELEKILKSEDNQKKLKGTLIAFENAHREFQSAQEKFLQKTKDLLTLEQQARLLLFQEKFEQRLKETIRQIRGEGPRWKKSE